MRRWRSDSLTVIKTPEGIDSNKIVKNAYSRYNLSIGIGLSQVRRPAQFGNGWGRRGNQVLHHVLWVMIAAVKAAASECCAMLQTTCLLGAVAARPLCGATRSWCQLPGMLLNCSVLSAVQAQ
jgi:hypothetical protein